MAIVYETKSGVGSREPKREGDRFLTGRMEYSDDLRFLDLHHVAILRSPYPHARIVSVDLTAARALPGVVYALSGSEAQALADPIPHWSDPRETGGNTADIRCLAVDEVLFQGQPVAAVVARTVGDARAALSAIVVEYEELPFVLEMDQAVLPDAPLVYDHWTSNVVEEGVFGAPDVDAQLAASEHVLSGHIALQRHTSGPIEMRVFIGDWSTRERRLTAYGTFQNPHIVRGVLASAMRLREAEVRVVAPTIGGAFGLKMHGHPEELLVCVLSRELGVPVKWADTREECLQVGAREQTHRYRVGFSAAGRVTALEIDMMGNIGALSALSSWDMVPVAALTYPTAYAIEHCSIRYRAVTTNKAPWNGARGYGKESTNLTMERIMDRVARVVGLDPVEVRKINFIPDDAFPYQTAIGLVVDSGRYSDALDGALSLLDYEAARARQSELRALGRFVGIGIAYELTPEGADIPNTVTSGFDTSTVRVGPAGDVSVLTGVTTPGGGNETGIAQIVASELGVQASAVRVVQGDTDTCPYGFGNFSGRSMLAGGGASLLAARDVRERLLRVGSRMLDAAYEGLGLGDGHVFETANPSNKVALAKVAEAVYNSAFDTASDIEPLLESTRTYKPDNIDQVPDELGRINPYPTYSNGAFVVVVEVDVETGAVTIDDVAAVHDCGTMINPALVEGQTWGGIVMGIGSALMEHQVYDDAGVLQTDRLKTYLMPRAGDLPTIRLGHQVTPSPFSILGTKGAGEASVGGTLAAIANAVEDALAPLNVVVEDFPLNPPRVLALIESAENSR